nr:hypothetical protein [Tanacetum cinerariifolium]
MGSLDSNSDKKVVVQEDEISSDDSEFMVDSTTTSDKNDLLELVSEPSSPSDSEFNEPAVHSPTDFNEDKASTSSSTSSGDFTLEDPFQDTDSENGENANTGTIESPEIQVMERPSSEQYRIPSSVFARKESNSTGWGMASNESLFSINMGGMSFRNQDSMVWRSGDLDLGYSIEPSPSRENKFQEGKTIEVETIPELDETGETSDSDASDKNLDRDEAPNAHKFGEEDKIHSLSELSVNPGTNIGLVNPNLQDNQDEQVNASVVEELNTHFAAAESGDRSSFAFPILTAGTSSRTTGSAKAIKSEPQVETQPNSASQPEPDKHQQPSAPKTREPMEDLVYTVVTRRLKQHGVRN